MRRERVVPGRIGVVHGRGRGEVGSEPRAKLLTSRVASAKSSDLSRPRWMLAQSVAGFAGRRSHSSASRSAAQRRATRLLYNEIHIDTVKQKSSSRLRALCLRLPDAVSLGRLTGLEQGLLKNVDKALSEASAQPKYESSYRELPCQTEGTAERGRTENGHTSLSLLLLGLLLGPASLHQWRRQRRAF